MKSITSLVQDIYSYLDGNAKIDPERVKSLGDRLASTIADRLSNGNKPSELRMSNFGTKCDRKLWYTVRTPEDAEPLDAKARFKFLYGDILEEIVLFLAQEAGHEVLGTQDTLELGGIQGHRDAIIDGMLVDVKTASPRSFDKFKYHALEKDDPFGYLDQLGLYLEASQKDEALKVRGEAGFVAVDKVDGSIVLDRYRKQERDWEQEIHSKKEILASDTPPPRAYVDEAYGKSENRQLPMPCRYCAFKHTCWPGLRTFNYSGGPRYLTRVVRDPEVEEITIK